MADKESSIKDFEWARTRMIRERDRNTAYTPNRAQFLLKQTVEKHGEKAAREMVKEFNSNSTRKRDR